MQHIHGCAVGHGVLHPLTQECAIGQVIFPTSPVYFSKAFDNKSRFVDKEAIFSFSSSLPCGLNTTSAMMRSPITRASKTLASCRVGTASETSTCDSRNSGFMVALMISSCALSCDSVQMADTTTYILSQASCPILAFQLRSTSVIVTNCSPAAAA